MIVATPGRLWDLISSNQPHVSDLDSLEFFVIDEADKMVKQGNFKVRVYPVKLDPCGSIQVPVCFLQLFCDIFMSHHCTLATTKVVHLVNQLGAVLMCTCAICLRNWTKY